MYPQQYDEDTQPWSVHRPSLSPSQLTQAQINLMIFSVFCTSFILNFTVSNEGPAGRTHHGSASAVQVENWLVIMVLTVMTLIWLVLIIKVRECMIWPEEVCFRRNGKVTAELGCSYKVLDTEDGGVTLYRKKVRWYDGLGVFANAVTDVTLDDIFVLVPTNGSRYWSGFAFQPEDPNAFLHDCRHAGVVIGEEELVNLAMGEISGDEENQQNTRTNNSLRHTLLGSAQNMDPLAPQPTPAFSTRAESFESDVDSLLPEEDQGEEIIDGLKNTNVIEV